MLNIPSNLKSPVARQGIRILNNDNTSLPIWVQLPKQDLMFWSAQRLSKNDSLWGKPLAADEVPQDKSKLQFARMLVDMQLSIDFSDNATFWDEKQLIVEPKVEYERKPVK